MDSSNVVVLRGCLSSDPVTRTLESGSVLISLEVTTRDEAEVARSVPVSIIDPPRTDELTALGKGDEVVVAGSVARRFFRTATGTASRTEVVAERIVPAGRKSRVRTLLSAAAATLDDRD
jgi:single-strand DNA-binding protein